MLRSERRFPLRPRVPHFSASASHMKRLVGSLTASWRNLASNLRHCTRSFIVTSGEMHFPRHFRPVLTTKSLRFGTYILRASLTAIRFSLPLQLRFPSELSNDRHERR